MLIAQISDTHILARTSEHPSARLRADWLRRTVVDINREAPDAVIFTGDTVQHGQPDEYALLRELLEPLHAPFYMIPGNRDNNASMRAAFGNLSYFPPDGGFLHYAVEEHDLRLIGIDSTSPGERKGVFCQPRQAWLDALLSEQPDRPTLLFIHHPPFDVDNHFTGGYRRPAEAAALGAVIRRHPQVLALLCGHVHWPVERIWAGVQAHIMPSLAVDLRKGVDEIAAGGRPVYKLYRRNGETGIVCDAKTVETGP